MTTSTIDRIQGPGELLPAVPYLLGFHPDDSLVLVGLRPDRTLLVTARLDLADAFGVEEDGFLLHTLARIADGGASTVLAVIYPAAGDQVTAVTDRHRGRARRLQRAADATGCRLGDVLLVGQGRWWPLTCDDPGCCDPGGAVLPAGPTPYVAAATVAGIVPLPDRAALSALLDPAPTAEREELRPLLTARRGRVRGAASVLALARAADAEKWTPPADGTLASVARALRHTPVRDAVWLALDARELDGRALWRTMLRRMPSPWDAAPAFLYGWASWRAGNGALARIAAERAVSSGPGYSAAELLLEALAQGLDPHTLPPLRLVEGELG